jgi:hypothetical protein
MWEVMRKGGEMVIKRLRGKSCKKRKIKKYKSKKKIFGISLVMKLYLSSINHAYLSFGCNVKCYGGKIALNG